MLRAIVAAAVVLSLSGCATVADHPKHAAATVDLTRHSEESARAKHYLSVLWAKKNRFEQSHPELFDAENAPATDGSDRIALAECRKMDAAGWAESVRYGQDFVGYENFVVAMQRCLDSADAGG